MTGLTLSLRLLWRDWRAGELRLLLLATVVAVAAVTSVAWLADRVGAATAGRAATLLAAERLVRSSEPIPQAWLRLAQEAGLATARTTEFASVVLVGERTQLVAVKAVTPDYPLRGHLRVRKGRTAPEHIATGTPKPGTVWVEPQLLTLLGLSVGDTIHLGRAELRIAQLLTLEPDRGGFLSSFAPRVMMSRADLPATDLIHPASRVRYELLLAGRDAALARVSDAIRARADASVEILTPAEVRPGVVEAIERARRFLGLAALLSVIVAGVAVLLTARHYATRQLTSVAVMRCVGATRARIAWLFAGKLAWLALIAGALGAAIGFGLHALMLAFVADLFPRELPPPGLRPLAVGWLTAAAALAGFALPTLLRLRRVTPMRVLRRDLGEGVLRGQLPLVAALAVILALMFWQAGDVQLVLYVFGALAGTVAVLALAAWTLVWLVRRWYHRSGSGHLLWLSGLTRRPWTAVVQMVAIGCGLMALFLLVVVRQDLLTAWRETIPADAPDHFLVNIQPAQVAGVRRLLAEQLGIKPVFYPVVRARLVAINGRELSAKDYQDPEARRFLHRVFNLTWTSELQEDNRIVAGQWWQGDSPDPAWSVAESLAETLGIELGDRLTFEVAGRRVSAPVTSLRHVEWDSFSTNFFVIGTRSLLGDFPATWITSFRLPPGREALMAELVRRYPSVTVIDVGSILRMVRRIIEQGSRVVELMAALTLVAGVVVLLAALQITGTERRFETALLRALGASRRRVRMLLRAELALIGASAGLLAGSVATLAGAAIARGLFDLDYPVRPLTILAGGVVGLIVVLVAGEWGAQRYYRVSPMRLLREGES